MFRDSSSDVLKVIFWVLLPDQGHGPQPASRMSRSLTFTLPSSLISAEQGAAHGPHEPSSTSRSVTLVLPSGPLSGSMSDGQGGLHEFALQIVPGPRGVPPKPMQSSDSALIQTSVVRQHASVTGPQEKLAQAVPTPPGVPPAMTHSSGVISRQFKSLRQQASGRHIDVPQAVPGPWGEPPNPMQSRGVVNMQTPGARQHASEAVELQVRLAQEVPVP